MRMVPLRTPRVGCACSCVCSPSCAAVGARRGRSSPGGLCLTTRGQIVQTVCMSHGRAHHVRFLYTHLGGPTKVLSLMTGRRASLTCMERNQSLRASPAKTAL